MRIARWIVVGIAMVGGGSTLAAQGGSTGKPIAVPSSPISVVGRLSLQSFAPVDSFFFNPTQTSFTVALVNTISGSATEYRVSRFADFRDGTWRPYNARPSLVIPGNWFTPASTSIREVVLYFQVRAKNPKAGMPISIVDGKTQVQPDFFFSDVLSRRVRIEYAG